MAVCDKDCFHCKFDDCVNDRMDAEDYRESREREKELTATPKSRKLAARRKAYYEANREKVAAYQKEYYMRRKRNEEMYREKLSDEAGL